MTKTDVKNWLRAAWFTYTTGLPSHYDEKPRSKADEAVETAAQKLHAKRHPVGYAQVCGQCRDDAQLVADVLRR